MKLIVFQLLLILAVTLQLACSSSEKSLDEDSGPASTDDLISKSDEFQDKPGPVESATSSKAQAPVREEKKISTEDYYQKFNKAVKAKQTKAATDAAAEILARNPKEYRVYNGLSALAIEQGKYELARMYISKVLTKDSQNAAAYNNLGLVELKSDNLRQALANFKKAVEIKSSNKAARANLGIIYLQYRNYKEAASELQLAVNNGDESASTYNNLGMALKGEGRFDDAEEAYEEAMTKDGSNQTVQLNYAMLLIENLNQNSKALKILNKLRFTAKEPAILDKVNNLIAKAEGKEKKNGKAP